MKLSSIVLRAVAALLRSAMRREVRRELPRVFRLLDYNLPPVLAQRVEPAIVEDLIADAIVKGTGGVVPTADEVRLVAALFDPTKATVRLSRRNRL